eukprot:1676399-Rhodomonas_salina.1
MRGTNGGVCWYQDIGDGAADHEILLRLGLSNAAIGEYQVCVYSPTPVLCHVRYETRAQRCAVEWWY